MKQTIPMIEQVQAKLDALIGTGQYRAQRPMKALRWINVGHTGMPSKNLAKTHQALRPDHRGTRVGTVSKAEFHMKGPVGTENKILALFESNNGNEVLGQDLTGITIHTDNQGNYRLTVRREENPDAPSRGEKIPLLKN